MNFKFKMYKASWIILIGFMLLFVLDMISTFRVGGLVQDLETNPLYLVGGWFPVIIMNFISLYILLKAYSLKDNLFTNWIALSGFFYMSATRIWVIINNWNIGNKVLIGEITKETISTVSDQLKINAYLTIVSPIAIGIIMSYIIFLVYKLDFKIERRID